MVLHTIKNEEELLMFGVSPAFIVSLYGPQFSISQFCEALPLIRKIGFFAYQKFISRQSFQNGAMTAERFIALRAISALSRANSWLILCLNSSQVLNS
jgi:hypothetical protein